MNQSVVVKVTDTTGIGEARRAALMVAGGPGWTPSTLGQVGIIVTEAATNLVRHAGGGEIVLRKLDVGTKVGMDILSLDKGPGMANLNRCMQDGFSTAGTSGNGLGSIARQSDLFDVYTVRGAGTVLLSRIWGDGVPAPTGRLDMGIINLAKDGEEACGDSWAAFDSDTESRILMVDGLGHGPAAAAAALAAIQTFHRKLREPLTELFTAANVAMKNTRGAAGAVIHVRWRDRQVEYAGIGNIAGVLYGGEKMQTMISHNGIIGQMSLRTQIFSYTWPQGGILVMHSDGLTQHWRLENYPGLAMHDPAVIAGVLYRDFTRPRDDATVLVAKERVLPV